MAHRSFSVRRFCRLGALMLLLFGLPRGAAAQGDDPGFVNWTDSVGFFFDSLAVSDVPSGILYERMIPFGPAPFLFGAEAPETPLDTATRQTLRQTYASMYSGVQNANIQLAPPDSFFGAYFAGPDTFDYRPLAFFHHNFHAIRDSAFADSALVLSADSTYFTRGDTSAPEPFGELWAAVAAPVYETVERGPVNWRLPSDLFFTAYPSPVSQIRFDPGDGGGFRTAELDADVAADYTEADEHENIVMVLEVTYADGALWQMLLLVTPYSYTDTVPEELTNAGYEKSDFKVTRDPGEPLRRSRPPLFAGRAFDRAEMRVLYRCKEQGLRKPLILVEGFDPKDEENSQERLEHIISGSGPAADNRLLYRFDEGEYDIVYIRFRNQWDYIENMGQLLQEALEWINDEKAAAGSSEPNVVWGYPPPLLYESVSDSDTVALDVVPLDNVLDSLSYAKILLCKQGDADIVLDSEQLISDSLLYDLSDEEIDSLAKYDLALIVFVSHIEYDLNSYDPYYVKSSDELLIYYDLKLREDEYEKSSLVAQLRMWVKPVLLLNSHDYLSINKIKR